MFSSKTRPGYCSRCQSWLGQEQQAAPAGRDIRAEVEAAEMMGDLVAASASFPAGIVLDVFRENLRGFIQDGGGAHRFRAAIDHSHIRNWVWRATIPRMDSFLKLARALNVSVVRLLTERIHGGSKLLQRRALQTPHKVSGGIVEAALQDAIQSGSPPALKDIATQLGYRTPASLQSRYPGLCGQIANSRQADVKASRPLRTPAMPVPRERIVTALIKELSAPGFTDLKAVAASVGLSSKRRLYKDFHELRTAIVAKNAQFRNRQGSPCGESALRAVIDGALHKAFDEQPIPTVAEVATRLGFADARPVDWRFPELTAALRSRRHRAGPTPARGDRVSERVRQRLTEALAESPPPSCSEIVKSLAGHRTQIREDFPDLWRDLRKRYVEDKRYTRQLKQQAFAGDVCCAVAELHKQGLHPSVRLVLASIPEPRFRSGRVVGEAIHLARLKLSIELYADYRVGHA
jgi:hypothetical protein